MKNITLNIQDNIAYVTFDLVDEKVNKLSFAVLEELNILLDTIKNDTTLKLVVFDSAKSNIFIAGADINEIKTFEDEAVAYKTLIQGDDVLTKIEKLSIPTVAYVNGACMGGGLEFVLCCNYIVASSNEKTKFAFPEVKLGFFPGLGGTQRMPKRVGLVHALDMILSGKTIDAKKALRMGLVNAIFDHGQKEHKLPEFIQNVLNKKIKQPRLSLMHKAMQSNALTRDIIYKKTLESIQNKVNPDFKAPYLALDVIKQTFTQSFDEGILIEAKTFAKLAITKESKNLIDLFFMFEKSKKSFEKTDNPIQNTAVLGNGIMGRGIIWLFTKYLKEVRVKVRKIEQIQDMLKNIAKDYAFYIKTRKMTKKQVEFKLSKISYTQEYTGFGKTQLALEAIIEDKKAKRDVFEALENVLSKDAIIATNTSSISIETLAKKVKNQKNFLGVHFFNPVNKMPLVEVIPTKQTSKETINKVFELLVSCGKTPILVGDCAGFVVNRVLLPYINEAGFILEEGSNIKEIDQVLKSFGLPMGPFTLADTVGIDIGFHVATILEKSYGDRMPIAPLLSQVYEQNLLGIKTKKGFYIYGSKQKDVNEKIYTWQKSKKHFTSPEIVSRCIYIMINEASRILEENIVEDAQTVDLAMIAGMGFPPYKGGLLKYADEIGIKEIVTELKRLKELHGKRFEPSKLLRTLDKQNKTFYTGEALWKH